MVAWYLKKLKIKIDSETKSKLKNQEIFLIQKKSLTKEMKK